ncbi:MAG: sulfate reduction electron transfer complex DsrMKJOP subunit DsrJ [Deltaproteobacteria bacterium]|nr:sulfate reduction electron transfer complex DsrMKJOP subunit DsrJ [Deltaproteobacteria bacterium]
MYDSGKIIGGLVLFTVAAAFPVWYTHASGKAGYQPNPVLPEGKTKCVESKEYMLSEHMNLLDEWRDLVVREGQTTYVSTAYGDEYEMSFTKTCLDCHEKKEEFCDKCHTYADVTPYCWDCHVEKTATGRMQHVRVGRQSKPDMLSNAEPSRRGAARLEDKDKAMTARIDSEPSAVIGR